MKAPSYTEEQIIQAGQQLLDQQKTVTPFGIRKLIGGGNPTRIKAIWQDYQQNNPESEKEVTPEFELPPEFSTDLDKVKAQLDAMAKRIYNEAHRVAESRVKESITSMQNTCQQAEVETQEAMETVTQQDKEIQTLQEHMEAQDKQQHALKQQIAILQAQKDDLNARLEKSLAKEEQAKIEAAEIRGKLSVLLEDQVKNKAR